ncbi:MAG TPA: hypothetical protein DCO77_12160 [Nitrospiraceae bacterium]|nr:hypothetical protein [Nitrospiraceae bacterium]
MKKYGLLFLTAALCITLFASQSFASGFRLPESSASAMGMASAFVGQADDPTAVWYNPAGITQLDGTWVAGGTVAIYPTLTHENTVVNPGTTDVSNRTVHLPIHLFGTQKMSDNMSLGIGITNPFGLSTDWASTSSTNAVATYTTLVTTNVNPNIAYQLSDNLSLAVGLDYLTIRATLERTGVRISGDGDGWGLNAAALYKATEELNLGLSYRSRTKVHIDGTATAGPTAAATTSITFPDLIQFGGSYKASDDLTYNVDLEYTMWSTYDRLVIDSVVLGGTVTDPKEWNDTWVLRLGAQYKLSDVWKVRAGYLYDQTPVPEEYFETRTPDSDRNGLSIGAGYASGNITVDASYLYLKFKNRTINDSLADGAGPGPLNGNYKSQAHLAGVTVGYKF